MPGLARLHADRRAGRSPPHQPVVDLDAGRELASSRGPGRLTIAGPRRPSGRPRRARGRRGVRDVGRQGVCRPRRSGSSPRAAGSRARAYAWGDELPPTAERWPTTGRVTSRGDSTPEDGYGARRPVGSFPAQRLRAARHGRQRVGVDDGLVHGTSLRTMPTSRAACRSTRGAEHRGAATTRRSLSSGIPRKVIKGGSFLCADSYCHALPAGRQAAADDRHRHEPHRLPMRDATRMRRWPLGAGGNGRVTADGRFGDQHRGGVGALDSNQSHDFDAWCRKFESPMNWNRALSIC